MAEAEKAHREALRLDDQNYVHYSDLGVHFLQTGRPIEAAEMLANARKHAKSADDR